MPRVRPEHKAGRRAQIIAAARTCFARDGFRGTTLQDVFAEAGLSAGCVYSYFRSKEELVVAIADDRHRDEHGAIAEAARSDDPVTGLRSVARHFVEVYLGEDGDERRRIAIQTWSEALLHADVLAAVLEGVDAPRRQLVDLLRAARAQRTIAATLDPDSVARAMIAMLHGFVLQRLWDPAVDLDAAFAVFEHFLASLSPETRQPSGKRRRRKAGTPRARSARARGARRRPA